MPTCLCLSLLWWCSTWNTSIGALYGERSGSRVCLLAFTGEIMFPQQRLYGRY
eukprot:jgi/Botrbrau1/23667/Bobra.55_2s0048.1